MKAVLTLRGKAKDVFGIIRRMAHQTTLTIQCGWCGLDMGQEGRQGPVRRITRHLRPVHREDGKGEDDMTLEQYKVTVPEGQSGEWQVNRFTVGPHDMKALYYALHGRPVPEGVYTRLLHNGDVVMSDTPMEILDHLEVIRIIEMLGGYVLINGLGLGVVLKAALASPKVEHIEVIEISEDVITLVGPTYQADPRLTIHHADAFTFQPPKDITWTVVWHDIWSTICSDNLAEMGKLHRKYGKRVAGWQGSWAKAECLRNRHQGY